jgi:CRP-like cAMP-binding protein
MAADPDIVDALSRTDLFAGVKKRALSSMASEARVVHHDAGKEITEEGGGALAFHLIHDGQASVTVGGQRRPDLGPGDYFGEISLIDGKPRSATIRAETPLTTIALSSWSFDPILEQNPDVVRQLLNVMCARLRAAEH